MVTKILKIIKKKKKSLVVAIKNVWMKFLNKILQTLFEVLTLGLQQHTTFQVLSVKTGKNTEKY